MGWKANEIEKVENHLTDFARWADGVEISWIITHIVKDMLPADFGLIMKICLDRLPEEFTKNLIEYLNEENEK